MNVSWFHPIGDSDPPYPLVTTIEEMSDGHPSIKVHADQESLRLMWAEIERLTALIDGSHG